LVYTAMNAAVKMEPNMVRAAEMTADNCQMYPFIPRGDTHRKQPQDPRLEPHTER
jgi:hypothetical protein